MLHILLVDDESLIGQLLKRHLEISGYRVTIVHNSITALEMVQRKAVDAAIMDICIPGLNDEELLPQLRMYQPDLPAIIISSYTRNFIWDMDEKTKLFSKPVDLPKLALSLDEMLRYHTVLRRVA